MYIMYSNIRTYSSSGHHAGLINRVYASSDIFSLVCPGCRVSGMGYSYWLLMYIKRVKKDVIAKSLFIVHLNLLGFINSNVLNIGSLIDPYNDKVIPRMERVIPHGINNSFNVTQYLKT